MRIGIISLMQGSSWGGSEALWWAMARAAQTAGHQVLISMEAWPVQPAPVTQLEAGGARFWPRHPRPGWGRVLRGLRLVNRYCPTVRVQASVLHRISGLRPLFTAQPDVLCISQGGTYDAAHAEDLPGYLQATALPYVVVSHAAPEAGPPEPAVCQRTREFFSQARRVALVAERAKAVIERQLMVALPNAVVVRNPVNLTDLSPVAWPEPGSVRLACVAMLTANGKGQDLLFETLRSEPWKRRDWRLSLYGDGPDKDYLHKLAEYYGLTERVCFAGHVEDIRGVWAQHHLLVLPSRSEMAPLALVEAMLCGRPAVVTDVGGVGEWAQEPATAFVAEGANPRALGRALERAWQAQADWPQMGVRAHHSALARHDPKAGETLLQIVLAAAAAPD